MASKVLMKSALVCLGTLVAMVSLAVSASATDYNVLYNFGTSSISDGQNPYSGVIRDSSGNIYGTTVNGGQYGDGAIYKIDPTGVETVLYSFTGGPDDGGWPGGPLMMDSSGNLYGTASGGGEWGSGTVFEFNPTTSNFTLLYSFTGGNDGASPYGDVIMDSNGNLYGTAFWGGYWDYGTVFKLDPTTGNLTTLFSFADGNDGANPTGGLIRDSNGNLYGTTIGDGFDTYGTVFKLNPTSGSLTILHVFGNQPDDGVYPGGNLVMDSSGNLYGTTSNGGTTDNGIVYKLDPSGNETILYSFSGGDDGGQPYYGLVLDPSGNLYGATSSGGASDDGVVYEVSPTGSETVLHSFTGTGGDGADAECELTFNSTDTTLYGTTNSGGDYDYGTVFEVTLAGPAVSLSPTSVDFGNQLVGSTSAPTSVTVTNAGTANLTFGAGAVTLSGTNAPDFTITADTCSGQSIGFTAPNNTCSVSVDFTPGTAASESASLNFADNAAGTPQTVGLSGTGVAPVVTASPNSLTFSGQTIGITSAAQTVTLSNKGSTAITISNITTSVAAFTATSACGNSLAANSSCTISVTFTPSATGTTAGTLTITDTAMSSPQTVTLTATGVAAPLSLNPSSLTFGSTVVETTSSAQTVTVTNAGTTSINMTGFTIAGDFAVNAAGTTCSTSVALAAGANCAVSVTFMPTATGTRTGNLSVQTNVGTGSVTLSGTGTAPGVSLTPSSLTFGSTVVGSTSSAQSVTLTNSGTSSLTITGVAVSSQYAETNTCGALPASLASKASCVISVTFTPAATGTQAGAVTIADSASGGTQTVALSGTGTASTLTLTPASLTFGSQVMGTTSTAESVNVTNTGTASLSFSGITATGDFAVNAAGTTCSTSVALAAGANCAVGVTFTPIATGTRTGSLNVASTGGSDTVALTGAGTAPGVTLTPSSLTFSGTVVGSTSSAQSATLTNSGTSSLTISGISVSGEFAIASAGTTCSASTPLAPSSSCSIAVTFTPDGPGTNTGTVTINDNAGSSPQTVALSGEGEDFSLAASTGSQTVSPGATATYSLQLSPEGGFNQAVSLACSGAPQGATCTVTPASVTLDGSSKASVSVKVSTAGSALVAPGPGNFMPPPSGSLPLAAWLAIFGLVGLIILVKLGPKGGRVRRAAPWATLALLAALCAGCGGGSSTISSTTTTSNSTPTGTYTLTVTATSGSLTQTTQVQLTVQ